MAIYPGAVVKLIPKHKTPLKASQVIVHTAVSNAASLYGFFSTDPLCSHFYLREDGTVEQYVDTKFQAPANRNANASAISIESWDGLKPDVTPWTPAQVVSLVKLILWAHEVHGVPLRLCASPTGAGVGWHSMWGAPSAWTPARGKTCPGPARIPQIVSILALANKPALKSGEDDDLTEEQDRMLREVHAQLLTKWPQLDNKTPVDRLADIGREVTGLFDFGSGQPKTTIVGAIGRLTRFLKA